MSMDVIAAPELAQTAVASGKPSTSAGPPEESLAHPDVSEMQLSAVLHALSDPMRLMIVIGLAATETPRTCKSFDLPVTKSTCTHHFRVLREAGVIRQKLEGTTRLSSLRRADLDRRFPGLLDSVLSAMSPEFENKAAPSK